jgi:AraC-like DNA-binding protein
LTKPLDPWLLTFYHQIKSSRGSLVLADAYERTNLSPKYVNERFKRAVGVSPKVLSRILRLDALLQGMNPDDNVNWADLAQNFGFYDQSHFNREFRRFSGLTPNQYLHSRRFGPMPMPKREFQSVVPEDLK